MHELAVAQALVEQVDAVIDRHGATQVSLVRLRIGPLAGVVPELLATAFPLAAAGSRMEHAELEFTHAPIQVHCQTCGAETEAAGATCATCAPPVSSNRFFHAPIAEPS